MRGKEEPEEKDGKADTERKEGSVVNRERKGILKGKTILTTT